MNQKKRKELEEDIAFFREQFQGLGETRLPDSLNPQRLAAKLDQAEQRKERSPRFTGRALAMACTLVLVVGLTVLFVRYRSMADFNGMLMSAESASAAAEEGEGVSEDALPEAAAYSLEGDVVLTPDGEGEDIGTNGGLGAAPRMAGKTARNGAMLQSAPAAPQLTKEEIKAIILELDQQGQSPAETAEQEEVMSDATTEALQKMSIGEISVAYDSGTGVITLMDGDEKSSLAVQPGSAVSAGETTLCVAEQAGDSVQVTLYWVREAAAAEQLMSCTQEGMYSNLMPLGGDYYSLLTVVQVTAETAEREDFLPKVDGKEIEAETVQIVHGGGVQPSFSISSQLSEDGVEASAMLLVP